jgi:hypothetical protein
MKEIPLTRGQVAIVDSADYEWLREFRWVAHKSPHTDTWYAVYKVGERDLRRNVWMHRLIMNAPEGLTVDHKDGDGLHNWRDNLRLCPHWLNRGNSRKNSRNTSGFKGVHLDKRNGHWLAMIRVHGKTQHIGCFLTPEEAAAAYDRTAVAGFGEFARTNAMLGLL